MKKQLTSLRPNNQAGTSRASPSHIKSLVDPWTTRPQETVEESKLNKSLFIGETLNVTRKHPLSNYVMEA